MTPKIVFNGREYGSAREMPADVRRLYEQAVVAQGGLPQPGSGAVATGSISMDAGARAAGGSSPAARILLRLTAAATLALAVWWLLRRL